MKNLIIFIVFVALSASSIAQSPIGKWKTIDDVENREKSIVEIHEKNGKLHGKVVKLFRLPDEDPDPICDKCSGDKKDQKVLGMEILWGLKKDGNEWNNGKVLDPQNGRVYDCYIEMESEDKLKLRGFMGFSLLGRTQYWYRSE